MNKLKVLFALLLLTCAAGASAQDVIVKKDGSIVVCRVVEVSATEIVYKKWTDLNGSNYVMNRTDASVINYENGTRSEMGTTDTHSAETTSSVVLNPQAQQTQQQLSDMQLMQMARTPTSMKKAKRLQRIGWISGGIFIGTGLVVAVSDLAQGNGIGEGMIFVGFGTILGAPFVLAGKNMEKRALNELQNSSLWQQEILLRNGTSLMAGVDMLHDHHTNTLGLGLRYSF